MWDDLYNNQEYSHESYDDSMYKDMQNKYMILIFFTYWLNGLHTTWLGYKYTRHFTFLNIHIIMYSLLYVILTLQSIKNNSCKQRYLFTCYENTTMYQIDDSIIDHSINIIGYIVAWLLTMTILIIIYMIHDNNHKRIYYITTNNMSEFFGLIIIYNIVTYCYIGLLFIIGCVIFSGVTINIPDDFTFFNGRIMNSTQEKNQFVKSSPTHHTTYTDKNKIHLDPEYEQHSEQLHSEDLNNDSEC